MTLAAETTTGGEGDEGFILAVAVVSSNEGSVTDNWRKR